MFCPKCGTENPETGKFCRSCGTDVSGVNNALNKKSSDSKDMWGGDWTGMGDPMGTGKNSSESGTPEDLFGAGVKGVIVGFGFLAVSMALLFTGVAGGKAWWWALLFPAFISFANGVSQIIKANGLKEKRNNSTPVMQNQFTQKPAPANLPPTQTEYVKPQGSIYDTGDLVTPPSVTENTTRHLEINTEGETMTLPKK